MSKADRKAHRALFDDTSKVIRRGEKLIQSLEAMLARRGDHKASADLLNVVRGSLKNLGKDAVALGKLGWPKKAKKGNGTKAANPPAKTSKASPRKDPKAVGAKPAKTGARGSRVKKTLASAGSVPDLATATPAE
jgi:hypothetical protein